VCAGTRRVSTNSACVNESWCKLHPPPQGSPILRSFVLPAPGGLEVRLHPDGQLVRLSAAAIAGGSSSKASGGRIRLGQCYDSVLQWQMIM